VPLEQTWQSNARDDRLTGRWRWRESNEGSALYLLLPTPASARPLAAAVGLAEPQKSFRQAALVVRIARPESLL
jgi:hypothetical protein